MSSVGRAYAILKGKMTGNKEEAYNFLQEISPGRKIVQNRMESKLRAKAKRKPLRVGQRPRARRGSLR